MFLLALGNLIPNRKKLDTLLVVKSNMSVRRPPVETRIVHAATQTRRFPDSSDSRTNLSDEVAKLAGGKSASYAWGASDAR